MDPNHGRGELDLGRKDSDGKFLGEASEDNRYHLRPGSQPKPLTLKGSSGKPTYGTVPMVLMCEERLSGNAKMLWSYLQFRQGNNETAWPSQTTIEAHTGMSRSTISRATKDLESLGWLRVFRVKVGTQRWNSYSVEIPKYAMDKVHSGVEKKQKQKQIERDIESERGDSHSQIDAVKTPFITPRKNTNTTTHQSRLVDGLSSMFHSIND